MINDRKHIQTGEIDHIPIKVFVFETNAMDW